MTTTSIYEQVSRETENSLANAQDQAAERRFQDLTIVDVDSHHGEGPTWDELVRHMEDSSLKQWAGGTAHGLRMLGSIPQNPAASDRIARAGGIFDDASLKTRLAEKTDLHPTVVRALWSMDMMGVDYTILSPLGVLDEPNGMLELGSNPSPDIEITVAQAYNRWLSRDLLPQSERVRGLAFLPFNDADACRRTVEEFAETPGIVGFVVSTPRQIRVHDNRYAPLYELIERSGKVLAFHSHFRWSDTSLTQLDKYVSVHALGYVLGSLIHMTNWVVNGIPERYPDLKPVWMGSGLAWVPFLMQRLDNEYMMRTSEAPLLTKPPSEYMKDMYYTTQPLERGNPLAMKNTFRMLNTAERVMYASEYPGWDCDMPSAIYDIPFLTDAERRAILGDTAARLFGLGTGSDG